MKRIGWIALLLVVLISGAAYGQGCSVCTQTAAGLGDKSAKGLNGGIMYLALIPLTIMGTIGLIWWRYNHSSEKG